MKMEICRRALSSKVICEGHSSSTAERFDSVFHLRSAIFSNAFASTVAFMTLHIYFRLLHLLKTDNAHEKNEGKTIERTVTVAKFNFNVDVVYI